MEKHGTSRKSGHRSLTFGIDLRPLGPLLESNPRLTLPLDLQDPSPLPCQIIYPPAFQGVYEGACPGASCLFGIWKAEADFKLAKED